VIASGNGSIAAALLAAALSTVMVPALLSRAATVGLPCTPATIFAGSVSAVTCGWLAAAASGHLLVMTELVRWAIAFTAFNPTSVIARVGSGAAMGIFTYVGASHGLYHRVVIPLLFVEMEVSQGGFAFFGALDLCCLCMTSAGVCLAVWASSSYRVAEGGA
jgi:hypothetical protein